MRLKKGDIVYTCQWFGYDVLVYEARVLKSEKTVTDALCYLVELRGDQHLWKYAEELFDTPVEALRAGLRELVKRAHIQIERWSYELSRLTDTDKVPVVKLEEKEKNA